MFLRTGCCEIFVRVVSGSAILLVEGLLFKLARQRLDPEIVFCTDIRLTFWSPKLGKLPCLGRIFERSVTRDAWVEMVEYVLRGTVHLKKWKPNIPLLEVLYL
jgi:hypothetical protein